MKSLQTLIFSHILVSIFVTFFPSLWPSYASFSDHFPFSSSSLE